MPFLSLTSLALHCLKMLPVPILPVLKNNRKWSLLLCPHCCSVQGWAVPIQQFYLFLLTGRSLEMLMLNSGSYCKGSPGYQGLNSLYPHGVVQHGAFTMGTVLLHHSSSPASHSQPESRSSYVTQKSPHTFIQQDTHTFLKSEVSTVLWK